MKDKCKALLWVNFCKSNQERYTVRKSGVGVLTASQKASQCRKALWMMNDFFILYSLFLYSGKKERTFCHLPRH